MEEWPLSHYPIVSHSPIPMLGSRKELNEKKRRRIAGDDGLIQGMGWRIPWDDPGARIQLRIGSHEESGFKQRT